MNIIDSYNMKNWRRLFNFPFKEFNNQSIKVLTGSLPEQLHGVLFRNTAAFLPRNSPLTGHWFDGVHANSNHFFQRTVAFFGYNSEEKSHHSPVISSLKASISRKNRQRRVANLKLIEDYIYA
jgi:hypothetical protein